jgi:hypothetical protein
MLAIGDKSRTAEAIPSAKAYLRSDLVSYESDDPSEGEKPEVGQGPWVDQPLDGLTKSDKGADEDREDHSEPSPSFAPRTAQVEGDPQWNCSKRIAEVVDEIGEQRNTQRSVVDKCLSERRNCQDRKT